MEGKVRGELVEVFQGEKIATYGVVVLSGSGVVAYLVVSIVAGEGGRASSSEEVQVDNVADNVESNRDLGQGGVVNLLPVGATGEGSTGTSLVVPGGRG